MLKVTASNNGSHSHIVNTGLYEGSDVINNIYDLEGNFSEWTLERRAQGIPGDRVHRGGDYAFVSCPAKRLGSKPWDSASFYGCRATIYIR